MCPAQQPGPRPQLLHFQAAGHRARSRAPACLSFLGGHDKCRGGWGCWGGPGPHLHLFGKLCLRTYCVPAPVPKGPVRLFTDPCPCSLQMGRGGGGPELNLRTLFQESSPLPTSRVSRKQVVRPREEARGEQPSPGGENQAQRGWVAGPRSHSKSGAQVRLPGPRPAAPAPTQASGLCCKVGPNG